MAELILRLHQFDDLETATRVADDIRAAGNISYVDAEGSTVNVSVGDVTVEN